MTSELGILSTKVKFTGQGQRSSVNVKPVFIPKLGKNGRYSAHFVNSDGL